MTNLKPCPFCGGEAKLMKQFESGVEVGSKIVCFDCLANFYQGEACDAEENIDAWNRRTEKVGEWIAKNNRWQCTRCDGIAPKGIRWTFCPNCGARMKGEEDG